MSELRELAALWGEGLLGPGGVDGIRQELILVPQPSTLR